MMNVNIQRLLSSIIVLNFHAASYELCFAYADASRNQNFRRASTSNNLPFITGGASSASETSTASYSSVLGSDNNDTKQGTITPSICTDNLDNNKNNESMVQKKVLEEELQSMADKKGGPLNVLFLSADTGGGHRASAESLANQFLRYYPGTTYDILDVWTPTNVYPFCTLVKTYQHLSANPRQWKLLYHISNTRPYEILTDVMSSLTCRNKIRGYIEKYDPDVVVSVHPTMNFVPVRATRKIARQKNKYIPFFTVVTDFGSAHCHWFEGSVDKLYVASQRIRKLARRRSNISEEKLIMSGLPIRHDFAAQVKKMGDRTTNEGSLYRRKVKEELGLNPDKRMVLVMGGGEGVGSLSEIAKGLYNNLKRQGIDATICVVCGRNDKLRDELNNKDWDEVDTTTVKKKKRKRKRIRGLFRSKRIQQSLDQSQNDEPSKKPGNVNVVGLGFVTRMAEYMVAADVLVTKAGPGTIAEAAAVGLPVMITSFLPGQEAGNVDIVLDGGFGDFCVDPDDIGHEVSCWLNDDELMKEMSLKSTAVGHPEAASEIVQDIGSITHDWLIKNKQT